MAVKPSQLAQVLVDVIEAISLPSGSKAFSGDTFRGTIGPPPMEVSQRAFGVELGVSSRTYSNACPEEHSVTATITVTYAMTADAASYSRMIDDCARITEALNDLRSSGVTNATAVFEVVVQSGALVVVDPDDTAAEAIIVADLLYEYGDS